MYWFIIIHVLVIIIHVLVIIMHVTVILMHVAVIIIGVAAYHHTCNGGTSYLPCVIIIM